MAGTGAVFTLADMASRTNPDGSAAEVAELLSQANEWYDDVIWKEGLTNTGHIYTVRTGLPSGVWRFLNQGVPSSKSTTAQGRVNCGMLCDQFSVDKAILDMAEDEGKYRYEEDNAHLEGMAQTIAQTGIYGNNLANIAQYTGLSNFYSTVNTANAANADNVFDGGGTGSNNSSIWVVGWSPRSIYCIYPKGSEAGLKLEPLDYVQVLYDNAGNPFRGVMTWFEQKAGLCVEDWRWGSRICNLDVTAAGLGGSNPFDIFADGLTKAVLRLPKMARGVSGVTQTDARSEKGLIVRPAIYCNRTVRGFMDVQAIRNKNVLLGPTDYAGNPVDSFRKVPIRVMDVISNAETRVT